MLIFGTGLDEINEIKEFLSENFDKGLVLWVKQISYLESKLLGITIVLVFAGLITLRKDKEI